MYESLRGFNNASSNRSILLIFEVVSGHNYLLETHIYRGKQNSELWARNDRQWTVSLLCARENWVTSLVNSQTAGQQREHIFL